MEKMLFEIMGGELRCRLPRRMDGTIRHADGCRILDLAQASVFSGRSEADLAQEYRATFEDLVEEPEQAEQSDSGEEAAETNAPENASNAEQAPLNNCRIWDCQFPNFINAGLLITEPGNVNLPIAFVPISSTEPDNDEMWMAESIAKQPDCLETLLDQSTHAIDLRPYSEWNATFPMPRWVYSLRCRPYGCDGGYTHTPTPFSRVLIEAMLKQRPQLMPQDWSWGESSAGQS